MIEGIKKITDAELKFISELDCGKKSEEHYQGLKQVIHQQECIITKEQNWYPYEVIELGSNWLQKGHEKEFFICTLLVILNTVSEVDLSTDLVSKFEVHSNDYDQLPKEFSEAILIAYQGANF